MPPARHTARALLTLVLLGALCACVRAQGAPVVDASPAASSAAPASAAQDPVSVSRQRAQAITPVSDAQLARTRGTLEAALGRDAKMPQVESLKARLLRLMARALEWLLARLSGGSLSPPTVAAWLAVLQKAVFALAVIALAVLIFLLVRHLMGSARAPRAASLAHEDPMSAHALSSAEAWLARAEMLRAQGDDRGALRCLYLALLRRLHEAGAVRIEPGQTNWEIVRGMRGSPYYDSAVDATRRFELQWYAMHPAQPDDFEHLRALYAQVRA